MRTPAASAAAVVSGPIETAGIETPSCAYARAAEAEASTTRSPSSGCVGRTARASAAARRRRRSPATRACARARPSARPAASGRPSPRGELRELPGQLGGVLAASPLEPRAVLRGDERGQLLAVVVRGNRCEATAADGEDARSLRLDTAPRLRVIAGRDELFLTGANLQGECALSGLRQQLVRVEAASDLVPEPEPVEAAGRQHDRVQAALAALAQTRVDVAAERLDRELGLERQQLCLAADRGSPDAHPRPQLRDAAERVARILAFEIGAHDEPIRVR